MQNFFILSVCCLLLSSCGNTTGGEDFTSVAGEVTYQGKPVLDGVIRLSPATGTQAPARTTQVKSGRYQFTERNAVKPGTYRVEIYAYRGGSSLPGDKTADSPEREQILPEQFNTQSKIEALQVQTGNGEIQQDYHLN